MKLNFQPRIYTELHGVISLRFVMLLDSSVIR